LRLMAPFLPFVTEEVWRWWQTGSIHRAPWPTTSEFGGHEGDDTAALAVAADVLAAVRRAKTSEKRSMRSRVDELVVSGPPATLAAVEAARRDLIDAGGIDALELVEAAEFSVVSRLAQPA
jgi:valyl-tRNA synthetase